MMYDFLYIDEIERRTNRECTLTISPEFIVNFRSKHLMVRGGDFYASYNEETGEWDKDEQTVIDNIDAELKAYRKNLEHPDRYDKITVLYMRNSRTGSIDRWHKFVQKQMRDNFKPLDEKITFANTKVKRTDYISKRLNYDLAEGDISAYDELIGTLYDEENRRKLEWAVGAIISGDSKHIQKFEVLYGSAGSGKSTFLNIVQDLFEGYTSTFDAKGMGAFNNAFALDSLKNNPLVSIQHDGDLSRIEDNTMLNSVVSHEVIEVNPKYGKKYEAKFNTFLFLGTNKPVKITEAKSGLLRRLIDVHPTGNKVPYRKYHQLTSQIKFELGAIAYHCLQVYKEMGEDYYESYVPIDMMAATNDFFDFMQSCYDDFEESDHVTLTEAWKRYKDYCDFAGAYQLSMRVVRNELRNYFRTFEDRGYVNGIRVRNLYSGFRTDKFVNDPAPEHKGLGLPGAVGWLAFGEFASVFDQMFKDWPAQYEKDYGKGPQPEKTWANCTTKLHDLDTSETHYTKPPEDVNILMIDFDLRDDDGNKSLELNLEAAKNWPKTYGELSKSGEGIHLYYFYNGDMTNLSRVYAPEIEIKVFTGNAAIRRKLTLCNEEPIATLNGGLPQKGEKKKKVNWDSYKSSEKLTKHIVREVRRNLKKEIWPDTTSSIHLIKKILDDAYESGIPYNVEALFHPVMEFAANSSNQKDHCLECVAQMHFSSAEQSEEQPPTPTDDAGITPIVVDIEVYPPDQSIGNEGLFLVCWKHYGTELIPDNVMAMVNPSPEEIEALFSYPIIGFNCRDYDNHMLWAASLGIKNAGLYDISYRIINLHDNNAKYGEAYNLSKWDVYEYCKAAGKRQGLKMWEIELGKSHMEMGIPWDQPAPKDRWDDVIDYCKNDVLATEAVFNATEGYRLAREFQVNLVKALHGNDIPVSTNDTANTLSKRAIFGKNKHPQDEFNYRDLSKPVGSDQYEEYLVKFGRDRKFRVFNDAGLPEYRDYIPGEELPKGWSILPFFPGYTFDPYADKGKKSCFHEDYGGEGGRTFSAPGMYTHVWDGDIASQYPTSIIEECLFGPRYTKIFADIVQARIAVKHKDFETAGKLLGGALKPYLSEEAAGDLAQGMKIIINSVYGLTKAGFENEFRDPCNVDNIVAKRGNLFMLMLKEQVELRGYKVVHIKTDSIKIAEADKNIENFVIKFGKEYGYNFETEGVFDKFVLLNDASYVAYDQKEGWITKAKQMQEPYVRKSLFTKEKITFDDMCQTFNVHEGAIYMDLNETLVSSVAGSEEQFISWEEELDKLNAALDRGKLMRGYANEDDMKRRAVELEVTINKCHNMQFIGRVGRFCPVKPGCGGGKLYRVQDGKNYAVAGTTGYRWLEAEYIKEHGLEDCIDTAYFTKLVDDAAEAIAKYGDLEWFINGEVGEAAPDFINVPEWVDDEVPFEE